MENQPARGAPGRRRSEESRQAILAAALDLVGEVGYAGLTVEGIAARAGTGKQTIYRWWPSKADVLLDALATKADLHVPVEDLGGYEAELRAFLSASAEMGRRWDVAPVLRVLMVQAQIDPGFGERFRAAFLRRRRDALRVVVDRALARGDLPAGVSGGTVVEIVFGVVWYRVMATHEPLDDRVVEELVAVLTRHACGGEQR